MCNIKCSLLSYLFGFFFKEILNAKTLFYAKKYVNAKILFWFMHRDPNHDIPPVPPHRHELLPPLMGRRLELDNMHNGAAFQYNPLASGFQQPPDNHQGFQAHRSNHQQNNVPVGQPRAALNQQQWQAAANQQRQLVANHQQQQPAVNKVQQLAVNHQQQPAAENRPQPLLPPPMNPPRPLPYVPRPNDHQQPQQQPQRVPSFEPQPNPVGGGAFGEVPEEVIFDITTEVVS